MENWNKSHLLFWRVFILSKVLEDIHKFHFVHLLLKHDDKQSQYEVNKHWKSKQNPYFLFYST